jgi:hypothetical protein
LRNAPAGGGRHGQSLPSSSSSSTLPALFPYSGYSIFFRIRKEKDERHPSRRRTTALFYFTFLSTPTGAKRTKTTDAQITCHLSRGIGSNETPSIRDWRAKIRGRRAEKKENKKHESRLQNVT